MVVLPLLRGVPPKGMADMSQTVTVKVSNFFLFVREKGSETPSAGEESGDKAETPRRAKSMGLCIHRISSR
jgi:hypothetical protein